VPQELNHVQASYNSVKGKILAKWERKDQYFEMEVRLPMNTNALIYIPTQGAENFSISESGKLIYDSNRTIEKAKGLTYSHKENNYIVFEAGSGEYHFNVKNY
jgi:alpha-L-rhamnosidase